MPDVGAFRVGPRLLCAGAPTGPLAHLRVAVKDNIDSAGARTGAGHPQWLESAPPAVSNASSLERLLAAGADLVGRAHCDELAWSMSGVNPHYGAPPNPAAPGHTCGGSSSGCASAVAAGAADIGLGTDTGGSIRVPASFCGLVGVRPTHARVSTQGALPLAPAFDTVGWLCRDARTSRLVGQVLLEAPAPPVSRQPSRPSRPPVTTAIVDPSLWELAGDAVTQALLPALDAVRAALGSSPRTERVADPDEHTAWLAAFRTIQAWQAWEFFGAWISRTRPELGPDVAARFHLAATIQPAQRDAAVSVRAAAVSRLSGLLGTSTVLLLPSAAGAPPPLSTAGDAAASEAHRLHTLELTCLASLTGCPAVSLPLATLSGAPLGLGIVGPPGADEELLELACRIEAIADKMLGQRRPTQP